MPIKPDFLHEALRAHALPALDALAPGGSLWNLEPTAARVPGVPYYTEHFEEQPGFLKGTGMQVMRGLYMLHLYGLANTGREPGQWADSVMALFPALYSVPILNGASGIDCLRVRGDRTPYRQDAPFEVAGFKVVIVTIPWYCETLRG